MRRTFILFLAFFSAGMGLAESQVVAGKGKIRFESTRKNFGEVVRGQTLKHVFAFKNVGDGALTIHGVHASCGCTAVEVDQGKQYLKGEVGQVEISFDTADFSGKVTKAVTVITNERVLPDRTLTISAFVKAEFDVVPPIVALGEVKIGETPKTLVKLNPMNGFPLDVKGVEYNKNILDVVHTKVPDGWNLEVTLKPGVPPGIIKDNIYVKTNSQNMGDLKIPFRAQIKGAVAFTPSYLEFGAIAAGDKSRRSLVLKGTSSLKIVASRTELILNGTPVVNADEFLQISSLTHEKEKQLVAIELKNSSKVIGNVHGKLFLKTDAEKDREMAVDFYAFFR
jgi:hypothetical protein